MLSKSEIKYLRSLKLKKFRQKYDQFVVEGEKTIFELCTSSNLVQKVFGLDPVRPEFLKEETEYLSVSIKDLEQISTQKSPQGLLALANMEHNSSIPDSNYVFVLDDIQDPGNLGTIIRIADWYGINKIICSPNSVDVYNPKTLAATMGSFCRVHIEYKDLNTYLNDCKIDIYACTMEGSSIYEVKPKAKGIILIGNEGKGIKDELVAMCKNKVSIPRKGKAESLNAAIAAAVVCDNLLR